GPIRLAAERPPLVRRLVLLRLERQARELLAEPLARAHPPVRPRDALRAVLVAGQLLELAELRNGAGRIKRHRRRAYRSSSRIARRTPAGATPTTSTSVRPSP